WSVEVPEGRLWALGDNRSNSADPRAHIGHPRGGTIPESAVVGTVIVTVSPLSHWNTASAQDLGLLQWSPSTSRRRCGMRVRASSSVSTRSGEAHWLVL